MPQWIARLSLTVLIATAGCGDATTLPVSDFESELSDLNDIEGNDPIENLKTVSTDLGSGGQQAAKRLQLRQGDSFQYLRKVEQSLTQQSRGARNRSQSNLAVTFSLRVDEVRDDRFLMTVGFSGVEYSHDIAGQKISFNSSTPGHALPIEVQPYRGLVSNEFSFWLSQDNSILGVEGFDEFLLRCVRYVPAEQHPRLLQSMAPGSPENAVAMFLDESVGLMPFGESAQSRAIGDSWNHDRQLVNPMPMYLSSACSLRSLSNNRATVSITGKIAAPNGPGPATAGVQLALKDGRTQGDCQFDLATGLPLHSRIERLMDLRAALSDGTQVRQLKQIVTTLESQSLLKVADTPELVGNTIQQTANHVNQNPVQSVQQAVYDSGTATDASYPGEANPFE